MVSDSGVNAWRCTVCGYVHRGKEPPDVCPVCGAPKDLFEAYVEPVEAVSVPAPKKWRCLVCNYLHSGDLPPDECPVCGTNSKKFESVADTQDEYGIHDEKSDEIVVVGGGIAGISAADSIRQSSSNATITLFSKEQHLPYFRLNLTRLLAGEITEDNLPIHPESWYQENNINLLLGVEISEISLDKHEVSLVNGKRYSYDKLILTGGAHPFLPPIPGTQREGVTALRTFNDVQYIRNAANTAASVAIIGGGILGMEIAGALAKYSINVTLFESFDWLMPRQLNKKAANLLQNHVEGLGINLKTGVTVRELVGDEHVAGVLLEDGEMIPANLVIIAAGIRSNSYLARLTGLQVNQGIVVTDFLETSVPNVYAAGDLAENRGILYGTWNAAQYQGHIAGMNAAGKKAEFGGIPPSNSIKVLEIDLLSIGKFEAEDGSYVIIEKEWDDIYTRFLFRDSHLVGSILYGNTSISAAVKNAIEKKTDFSGLLKNKPSAKDVWNFFNGS